MFLKIFAYQGWHSFLNFEQLQNCVHLKSCIAQHDFNSSTSRKLEVISVYFDPLLTSHRAEAKLKTYFFLVSHSAMLFLNNHLWLLHWRNYRFPESFRSCDAIVNQWPNICSAQTNPSFYQCCRVVVGSRIRGSWRFLRGVGVRVGVEKRILPETGVGVEKYMLDSLLPVLHKNLIKM